MLEVEFSIAKAAGSLEKLTPVKSDKDQVLDEYSLDILNRTVEVNLVDAANNRYKVYVSVYTNEH